MAMDLNPNIHQGQGISKNNSDSANNKTQNDPAVFAAAMVGSIANVQEVNKNIEANKKDNRKDKQKGKLVDKKLEEEELEVLIAEIDKRLKKLEDLIGKTEKKPSKPNA